MILINLLAILIIKKGISPYECMVSWEKFNDAAIPNKEAFYSKLNSENITNKDYAHAKKVRDVFEI